MDEHTQNAFVAAILTFFFTVAIVIGLLFGKGSPLNVLEAREQVMQIRFSHTEVPMSIFARGPHIIVVVGDVQLELDLGDVDFLLEEMGRMRKDVGPCPSCGTSDIRNFFDDHKMCADCESRGGTQ
jgi:hypothetical protein